MNSTAGLSQSKEISSDLCCFHEGGISHNEDAFFSKVYCCLILNYPTPIKNLDMEISCENTAAQNALVREVLVLNSKSPKFLGGIENSVQNSMSFWAVLQF